MRRQTEQPPTGRQLAGIALLGAAVTALVTWAVRLPWYLIAGTVLAQVILLTGPAVAWARARRHRS